MLKLILIIMLCVFIYYAFFVNKKEENDDVMVECSKCGVYSMAGECKVKNEKYICSSCS